MADYPDLASLRGDLTSDDPERRSEAYGIVYEKSDVSPSEVLSDDGIAPVLREAGILERPEDRPSTQEQRQEMIGLLEEQIALLEQIAANTGGA